MIWLSGAVRPELLGLRGDVGIMLTPNMGNRPDLSRTSWAADTGCFTAAVRFDWLAWVDWLRMMQQYRETCLFVTAPDYVGDAQVTLGRSMDSLGIIRKLGYRAAFVAQPGAEHPDYPMPWDAFDTLFIGGGGYKLTDGAWSLVPRARKMGKRLHMGGVNSERRLRTAMAGGYDSADGTYVKFGPDINLPKMLRWLDSLKAQPSLLEGL